MEPKCETCGTTKNLRVILKDLKDLSKGFSAVFCKEHTPPEKQDTNEAGTAYYPRREIKLEELSEIAQMVNPDMSCDFCDKINPVWLYDLDMPPMGFTDGEKIVETLDFGNRWTSCQECVDRIEAGKEPNRASCDDLPFLIQMQHEMMMTMLHQQVVKSISNKRPYVRDDNDGRVKIL